MSNAALSDLCAVLRGERIRLANPADFTDAAIREGLAPLVVSRGIIHDLPERVAAQLRGSARREAVVAAAREIELTRVLDGLSRGGVGTLLIKGAHLGYGYHGDPALRPREDTAALVRRAQRQQATEVLGTLGYRPQPVITGAVVHGQTVFNRQGSLGAVLDVHWRLASPMLAADLFNFEDLSRSSVTLPALGSGARV